MAPRSRPARLKPAAIAVLLLAAALALAAVAIGGLGLLALGIRGWLYPLDVPAAWARTLVGIGLLGGSAGAESLCWLALAALIRRANFHGAICSRVLGITGEETGIGRALKFIAAIGIVSALICLPLAAGLRAGFGRPWFGP